MASPEHDARAERPGGSRDRAESRPARKERDGSDEDERDEAGCRLGPHAVLPVGVPRPFPVTSIATPSPSAGRARLAADARDVGLLLLVGAAAGALAGAVVGGIGGRLVMFVLRLTSDPLVIGITSDDGFEIGRFTLGGTLGLIGGMAALGCANGALYVVLRSCIPSALRVGLWSVFAAAVGGMAFIHADGVDFTLLDPLWFAVLSFVALPGLAALVVVLLVERWLRGPEGRPHLVALALGAALGTVALALAAALWGAAVVARRLRLTALLARFGRIVVPAALVIGTIVGASYTVVEASRILG